MADMGLRSAATVKEVVGPSVSPAGSNQGDGQLNLELEDASGNPIHVEINSEELIYDSDSSKYRLKGDVYIIIPEKELEILANEATFDMDGGNLDASGNVFIFNKDQVTGSTQAHYDSDHQALFQKNFRTKTKDYRLRSDSSERYEHFQVLEHGRLIADAAPLMRNNRRFRWLLIGDGAQYSFYSASKKRMYFNGQINQLYLGTPSSDNQQGQGVGTLTDPNDILVPDKVISPVDVAKADFSNRPHQSRVRVNKMTLRQFDGGIDEIKFTHPRVKMNGVPLGYLPYAKFGHNSEEGVTAFLGPDVGYNLDYGGLYFGPSLSTHVGKGFAYLSPILTYGEGRRTGRSSTNPGIVDSQLGGGILGHYRSKRHAIDAGWNSTLNGFTGLTSTRIFEDSPNTRLRTAFNREYRNGFFGQERPNFVAELTDQHNFSYKNWLLQSYLSAGLMRDEFFPTGRSRFFVAPTRVDPLTTGRFQVQGQFQNMRPIFTIADSIAFNVLAQARMSAYGTGDVFGVFRGGPYMTFAAGPLFTQVRYLYTETTGSSPMVSDSYYEGSNNVFMVNSIDVTKHVTLGAVHNLNLDQDNARGDLVVGRQFFVTFGPESMKFSLGYDVVQRRSMIGITINPEGGEAVVDYNQFNMYGTSYTRQDERLPYHWDAFAPKTGAKPQTDDDLEAPAIKTAPSPTSAPSQQSSHDPLEAPNLRDTTEDISSSSDASERPLLKSASAGLGQV